MGFAMKYFALLAALFLAVSCSDSDKASGEKNQGIWIADIDYEVYRDRLYLIGILESEIDNCTSHINFGDCSINNCWIINGKYSYISLKNLGACHLKDYLWIIDGDTIPSSEKSNKAVYGEHFVELVLVDTFGDSISEGRYIQIDEPLRITMLSPVNDYEARRNETLVFQYRISGIDTWETWEDTVYVSSDEKVLENETLLWEEGRALANKTLRPPLNEQVYYWGVKISNQDTAFFSRIRSVWIKNLVY
ncbi:MAG: hypothetical protein FWF67_04360 [Fibromonadales bacterium]|nr:hypothetical protein [Fibromonadales bacterium]